MIRPRGTRQLARRNSGRSESNAHRAHRQSRSPSEMRFGEVQSPTPGKLRCVPAMCSVVLDSVAHIRTKVDVVPNVMRLARCTTDPPACVDPPVVPCTVDRQWLLGLGQIGEVWLAAAIRHRGAKIRTSDSEHADPLPISPGKSCAPGGSCGALAAGWPHASQPMARLHHRIPQSADVGAAPGLFSSALPLSSRVSGTVFAIFGDQGRDHLPVHALYCGHRSARAGTNP